HRAERAVRGEQRRERRRAGDHDPELAASAGLHVAIDSARGAIRRRAFLAGPRVRLVRLVRQTGAGYSSRVSKAFTRESDDEPAPPAQRRGVPVPEPNYMTPAGARAARHELASCTDEARIRELTDHLATAQIIEPPADRSVAGLGATVTIEDEDGKRAG